MDYDQEAAEEYLAKLGIVIWPGVSYDLTDLKERSRAAEWLVDMMSEMPY